MYRMIRYVVLVGCISLFSGAINAATNVQRAVSDYHQGDFESAVFQFQQILDQPVNSQTATANFMLGKMIERGEGLMVDDQMALSYYKKAAALEHVDAAQRLQEFSGNDESSVQDWYMEAAWDGDANAQYSLGYLYETGTGIKIDNARAIQWYEEASKKQHKNAQFRLGLLLVGVETELTNIKAGKYWLRAAAENGNEIANAIVNRLFEKADEANVIRALRGIRTYEQSSLVEMLAIIDNAFVAPQVVTQNITNKNPEKPASKPEKTPDDTLVEIENKIVSFFKTELNKLRIASESIYSSSGYRLIIVPVLILLFFLFWLFHRSYDKEDADMRLLPPSENKGRTNASNKREESIQSGSIFTNSVVNREPINVEPLVRAKNASSDNITVSSDLFQNSVVSKEEEENIEYIIGFEVFMPAVMSDITLSHSASTADVDNDSDDDAEIYSNARYDDSGLVVDYVAPSELSIKSIDELKVKSDEEQEDDDLLAESYYNIGMMFVTGEGVSKNVAHGIGWLHRSAELGHILAEFELDILREEEREATKTKVLLSFVS